MFTALANRLNALRTRYAEPHRAYHTQRHIDAMLAGLHELGPAIANPAMVELAIWYHDAIYDPAARDNEPRSADLLQTDLAGLAAPLLLAQADRLVRATADHQRPQNLPAAEAEDLALFLDLDMAILGASPADFAAYEQGIAAEYLPVHGPAAYHAGRKTFLNDLRARPRIFLTDRFHAQLDAPTRQNLAQP